MTKITQKKINDLRKNVKYATSIDGLPEDYLKIFAQPDSGVCLGCGMTGTFIWGLAHGEGYCAACGWPARLYHFVEDANKQKQRVVILLQYHPDGIDIK